MKNSNKKKIKEIFLEKTLGYEIASYIERNLVLFVLSYFIVFILPMTIKRNNSN